LDVVAVVGMMKAQVAVVLDVFVVTVVEKVELIGFEVAMNAVIEIDVVGCNIGTGLWGMSTYFERVLCFGSGTRLNEKSDDLQL